MKKNFVRIVAALLVAMLALTLIPVGAFAAEEKDGKKVTVTSGYYEVKKPTFGDGMSITSSKTYDAGSVIKTSDYNKTLVFGDSLYDFAGFENNEEIYDTLNKINSSEEFEAFLKSDIPFIKNNISIPKDLDSKDGAEWYSDWSHIFASYVPHSHKLSYWYSDGTTHWRECLVCKKFADQGFWEQFMYQNWCQDGDEDGICNICGGEVPYHDIKVIEVEGATITLNRDNASHRMKITADVEAKDGYTAGKVHFVKVRDDGSKQEITRYKKNGQFFTYMPTYEMEVSVDVTKK